MTAIPAPAQRPSELRKRIASLQFLQDLRVKQVEERKAALDALVADKQREIDNLKAQLESMPQRLRLA